MGLFDFLFGNRSVILTPEKKAEIKAFYRTAWEAAQQAATESSMANSADPFGAMFANHDKNKEVATQAARKSTMKKFRLNEEQFDSVWAKT